MATLRTVLHMVGSPVDDFHAELSRLYAGASIAALDHYRTHVAYVAPGGGWSFPADLSPQAITAAPTMPLWQALRHIEQLGVDVMVPQMFCLPGMTAYRSLFDTLGVPYLGSGADVMALAADKIKTRGIVAAAGVDVPAAQVVTSRSRTELGYPVVVKPSRADNSVGVTLATDEADYDAAIDAALAHNGVALVESYVELGREVRCGIVVRDGTLVCLPLEEYRVDNTSAPIRLPGHKLDRDDSGALYLVAKDDTRAWTVPTEDPITPEVWAAARRCHEALGCRQYSLFDFRIDPDGRPWFLEAGLYCSFAPSSVVVTMADATGVGLDQLFADALAELDRERTTCTSRH